MFVVDRSHVKELLSAPESHISFVESFKDYGFDYLFTGDALDTYHNRVILGPLTRGVEEFLPSMIDELEFALSTELGSTQGNAVQFTLW